MNDMTGKDILSIFARIMCVADARKGMDMKSALEEIKRCRGTQFDPEIADLLLKGLGGMFWF